MWNLFDWICVWDPTFLFWPVSVVATTKDTLWSWQRLLTSLTLQQKDVCKVLWCAGEHSHLEDVLLCLFLSSLSDSRGSNSCSGLFYTHGRTGHCPAAVWPAPSHAASLRGLCAFCFGICLSYWYSFFFNLLIFMFFVVVFFFLLRWEREMGKLGE